MPIGQHTHATALALVTFFAAWVVVHVTLQAGAMRHPDNPVWKAVAFVA